MCLDQSVQFGATSPFWTARMSEKWRAHLGASPAEPDCNVFISSADSRCLNPNQTPGLCVLINECQTLYSVLKRATLTDQEKSFIKSSACGRGSNNQPYVCCTQDTGYVRIQRQDRTFPDYGAFGGDWEEERPQSFVFPRQERRPWSFGNQPATSRTPFRKSSTSDGSSLLPQPPSCGGVGIRNRIYDGQDTDVNEFPWMVLLEYRRRSGNGLSTACAGSLINQRYVLTAAHCLTGRIEREVGTLWVSKVGFRCPNGDFFYWKEAGQGALN